jgi:hypothetical protein
MNLGVTSRDFVAWVSKASSAPRRFLPHQGPRSAARLFFAREVVQRAVPNGVSRLFRLSKIARYRFHWSGEFIVFDGFVGCPLGCALAPPPKFVISIFAGDHKLGVDLRRPRPDSQMTAHEPVGFWAVGR